MSYCIINNKGSTIKFLHLITKVDGYREISRDSMLAKEKLSAMSLKKFFCHISFVPGLFLPFWQLFNGLPPKHDQNYKYQHNIFLSDQWSISLKGSKIDQSWPAGNFLPADTHRTGRMSSRSLQSSTEEVWWRIYIYNIIINTQRYYKNCIITLAFTGGGLTIKF